MSPFTIPIRTVDTQESLTAGLMPTCAASAGASPDRPPRGPTGAPEESQLCSDRVTGWWPLEGGVLLSDHPRAPALVPPTRAQLGRAIAGPGLSFTFIGFYIYIDIYRFFFIFIIFLPFYFFS